MSSSAAAVAASIASSRPAAAPAVRPSARHERREVAVEAGGVPAPGDAVEGVGAGADRLVRPALPVGQVVPALVARAGPVRQLVPRKPASARRASARSYRPRPRSSSWPRRARSRQRRAPGSSAGGRPAAGQALGVGVVEGQGVEREVVRPSSSGRLERRRPAGQALARHVVEEVEADRADPRLAGRRDGVGHVARRRGAGRAPGAPRRMKLWAPSESRVTPAAAKPARSPRSSGPGLASRVTSAPAARPNRSRTWSRIAATASAGRSDGVPPPR